MSTPFYDLASLVVVPSGYKASKVYAQKPLTTDGQLTFSRASTATRVNSAGLIETVASNVPRLDYQGATCGPRLNLEPQRTNLFSYSEQFDNAAWVKSFSILTSNAATSPDGYTNADKLIATSVSDGHLVRQAATLTDSTNYSLSVFAKAAEYDFCRLQPTTKGGTSNNTFFNLVTGVVANTGVGHTATIEDYGNGWYRCTIVYNAGTGATTTNQQRIGVSQDSTNQTFLGDDSSGIYIWGAQLEQASYATSYIPTLSAAVTRLADGAVKTGISSLLGASEGVVFLEVGDTQNNAVTGPEVWYFEMRKDQDNSFGLASGGGPTQPIRFVTKIAGTAVTEGEPAPFANSKIAIKYTSTQFKVFRNGSLVLTTNKSIGNYAEIQFMEGAGLNLSMVFNQFMIFKTALTDAQCTELTTL